MSLNIIIPLGGLGRRFRDEGYLQPKPLVRVCGKYIVSWVIDSLNVQQGDELYIPYNRELDMYGFREIMLSLYPSVNLMRLDMQTNGAAHTLYECMQDIPSDRRDYKSVCLDGDTFYTVDILSKVRKSEDSCGVAVFEPQTEDPIYSYVTLEDGRVSSIREKVKISDIACSGCYFFESIDRVLSAYEHLDGLPVKGEIYTSAVIEHLLKEGVDVGALPLHISDICVLGTPIQLRYSRSRRVLKVNAPCVYASI